MNRNIKSLFTILLFAVVAAVMLTPLALLAADNPVVPQLPTLNPWLALIPVAVPVLISVVKMFAPNIPTVLLPILAPILGAAADVALHFAGVSTLGPVWGALLGSAGVGIREIKDQLGKRMVAPANG